MILPCWLLGDEFSRYKLWCHCFDMLICWYWDACMFVHWLWTICCCLICPDMVSFEASLFWRWSELVGLWGCSGFTETVGSRFCIPVSSMREASAYSPSGMASQAVVGPMLAYSFRNDVGMLLCAVLPSRWAYGLVIRYWWVGVAPCSRQYVLINPYTLMC